MSIEELIEMFNLQKRLARDTVSEQQRIMDTVLNGAEKAAKIVANIKAVSEDKDVREVNQLFKGVQETMSRVKKPEPPVFSDVEDIVIVDPLDDLLQDFTDLRVLLADIRKSVTSANFKTVEQKLYEMNMKLWEYKHGNDVI